MALFIGTVAIAVVCAFLIPKINVNTDMTSYLPESYSMKQGMTILDEEFAGLKDQSNGYSLTFSDGIDAMPKGLGKTIIIGVAMVFVVLLIMCSSLMEVVLFLITIGVAVLINVGTNALLPSVSQTTNMISPVLQMVLSMDYCIIMMNRYRDERVNGKDPVVAMNRTVGGTSSAIFSSAFTTIVSLLMLCFIKLKIGADLGIVLAKGVTISLICTFTLLPALIIWCRKAIEASRKKVPVLPAARLAAIQYRFRYPIAVVFLAAVIAFFVLQRRTPIFFAPPGWDKDSDSTEVVIKPMLLLYSNEDEAKIPELLDRLSKNERVLETINYGAILEKPRTASEMIALASVYAGDDMPDIPDSLLNIVYYARAHQQRNEQFTMAELQESSEALKKSGLMPEGRDIDIAAMVRKQFATPAKPKKAETPKPEPDEETAPAVTDSLSTPSDTTSEAAPVVTHDTPTAPDDPHTPTYERITTQLSAAEMAEFLQTNPKQVATLYRMAGSRKGTMSPVEFISYVRKNILGKKRYAAFLPKGTDEDMARTEALYEKILAEGPSVKAQAPADSTGVLMASADSVASGATESAPVVVKKAPDPIPYTPLDALIDMDLSGKRYPSTKVCTALNRAGIKVSQGEMDLLYLYTAAMKDEGPETKMSPLELLNFLADTLLVSPAITSVAGDTARVAVVQARDSLVNGLSALRGPKHSAAVLLTSYEVESEESFAFVDSLRIADDILEGDHYWISESEMYKELKDGFPMELFLLTILTIIALYVIVGINFRSVLIPIPLIMTVLTGVYANVFAGGFGGHGIYYLAYLIVQGILMGATIDYSILFTTCFLYARQTDGLQGAIEAAYKGSSHSILTSGLILALVPFAMSFTMQDPLVASILKNLSIGAAVVLVFILWLLPGVLATLNKLMKSRKKFLPKKK
ncbi:MAG: MMPL family transporter [Bacteroidales bacterium]|nr:MMPL family transporter [Bacteroidales bacterium]